MDDETLVAAVARGDSDALGVLYMRYCALVNRAIRRTAPEIPSDEAEDLTQDVFLLLSKKAAAYESRMKCKAYLYGIAVKTAASWRRRTWLRRKLLVREYQDPVGGEPATSAPPSETLELRQSVRLALAKLPDKQRTVLLMYTVEGFSGDEIARILGIPAQTVRTRLFRAREMLVGDVRKERKRHWIRKETA